MSKVTYFVVAMDMLHNNYCMLLHVNSIHMSKATSIYCCYGKYLFCVAVISPFPSGTV